MNYKINDSYTVLTIYYQQKDRYVDVLIDTEDLEKVKDKNIKIFSNKGYYRPVIFNGKYYQSLQSFLKPNINQAYCKNKNYCDCRKDNITGSALEVEGLIENRALKIKESALKMSKEKRDNIVRGIRENRYTKNYSIKLQEYQLGEKNISAILTWDLVDKIRDMARNQNISQYKIAEIFNIGRGTVADIINYRTWTVKQELNERVYREDNIKMIVNMNVCYDLEFRYDDIPFHYILLKFENESLYIEKLSIEGLVYIEQKNLKGKCLASVDVYIPINKDKRMKNFYIISKMNPKAKVREYFYNLIDKAFNHIELELQNNKNERL